MGAQGKSYHSLIVDDFRYFVALGLKILLNVFFFFFFQRKEMETSRRKFSL